MPRSLDSKRLFSVARLGATATLVVALLGAACGADSDTPAAAGDRAAVVQTGSRAGDARRTGTITIGETTWTIVPAIQCSVFPGNIVSIAGHASGQESTEIVIDHDPGSGLVAVRVQDESGEPDWSASGANLTFEISGNTVRGKGRFSGPSGRTAEGTFSCVC